jgi:hypothetical protein
MLAPTLCGAGAVVLLVPGGGSALEKVPSRAPSARAEAWKSAMSSPWVSYHNTCTGWVWVWSGFEDQARFGVHYTPPNLTDLTESYLFFARSTPSGYGYTGSSSIHALDEENCPIEPAIETVPFLPEEGWNQFVWEGYCSVPFVHLVTLGSSSEPGEPIPVEVVTDRPAPGPTGPIACGTCYPTTRQTHSYLYGTVGSPLCPGATFFDGFCDAELIAMAGFEGIPVSVKSASWGSIRALYR